MKAAIEQRFKESLERVENLVEIYRTHLAGSGQGRRSHRKTDVLRAAVVMLHVAMEDMLRSLAYWKLPSASAEVLASIPLSSAAPSIKITLGNLAAHRGETIDDVIASSVNQSLERSNYNNTAEVASLLENIGVDVSTVNGNFAKLEEVMSRRHLIVHRADLDEQGGQGHHRVRSIGRHQVVEWVTEVQTFGERVLNEVN